MKTVTDIAETTTRISKRTRKPPNPNTGNRGGGRKQFIVDIAKVEEFAAQGLTKTEVAHALGCCPDTYHTKETQNPEIREAYARGRSAGAHKAARRLDKLIDSADQRVALDASKFYLARRAGWSETTEIAGAGGGPVAISLTISKDDASL